MLYEYCFARAKERCKVIKEYRLLMYYIELWQVLMSQFVYEGLPDSLPAEWIEGILISNGSVGIGERDGTLYCAAGGYVGQINGYLPEKYVAQVPAIGQITGDAESPAAYDISGEPGKTIVVGWNNASHTPDFDLMDTAAALTEGRTSEDINVIFSRLLRIPIARTSKEKAIFESAINAILDGRVEAISSDIKSLSEIVNECDEQVQFLDLVDVKDVDKLQYLNQYMDNQLKRFMRRHGCSLNITNKLAQQTNAEMHGADDYSMIYPLQQLHYRELMISDLNRIYGDKYGFTASVRFSDILKNNYDKVINYVPDELNEKGIVADDVTVENSVEEVENNETDNTDKSDT